MMATSDGLVRSRRDDSVVRFSGKGDDAMF